MRLRELTTPTNPAKEFLIYMLLILICGFIFNILGGVLAIPLFHISLSDLFVNGGISPSDENAAFLKFYQIINHLGMFTVPSVLYIIFFMQRYDVKELGLDRLNIFNLLLSILVLIASMPLTNWLIELNLKMHLPAFLSGLEEKMRMMEDSASDLTEIFFNDKSFGGLVLNLFMIALIPAIGEELVFRGILFRIFKKWIKNIHVTVFVAAILFSAMHLQFYGFLPRLVLGILFGYLFVITRSLWVPIIVHFINNGAAVLVEWLYSRDATETSMEAFGKAESIWSVVVSLLLLGVLFTLLLRLRREE